MKRKQHHYSKEQLLREMNIIAKETRMSLNAPWTAMAILSCYVMMKYDNWKSKRLQDLVAAINAYEDKWYEYEIELSVYRDRLLDKAGWTIEHEMYTEADITHKKGSFAYAMDKAQLKAQNEINMTSVRFLTWFFNVLIDNGFGEKRLKDVFLLFDKEMTEYRADRRHVSEWRKALKDEAGLLFEQPIDPKTQKRGSVMC